MKSRRHWLFLPFALLMVSTPVRARQVHSSPGAALKAGAFSIDTRLRGEFVADDRFTDDALANTGRLAMRHTSASWRGFSTLVEAEAVASLFGGDSFNNAGAGRLSNGVTTRPVVSDPTFAELNQAYVRWNNEKTSIRLGRQEIILGDARFVGNVGWRQNHQSYDAVVLSTEAVAKVALTYAYIDRVHRIFGDDKPMSSHVGDVRAAVGGLGELNLFAMMLDYDNIADAGLSTMTLGARLNGKQAISDRVTITYKAGFARQSDSGDNPDDIEADWLHAEIGAGLSGSSTVSIGFERLGGETGKGRFMTPLATLHAFNGWADQFLATPASGLEDLYLSFSTQFGRIKATGVVHDFSSVSVTNDFGREIDLALTTTLNAGPELGIKLARFMGAGSTPSVTKAMLWTSYRF